MANIEDLVARLVGDGTKLAISASVQHPVEEGGSWFVDEFRVCAGGTVVWSARAAPRRVDVGAEHAVTVVLDPPWVELQPGWQGALSVELDVHVARASDAHESVQVER